MKAAVVERLEGPDGVVVADRPEPRPEGAVLVAVHAAGVSFPDLLLSRGQYQIRRDPPFVLGVEAAGTVVSAPAGSGFRPGQRVVASAWDSWAEMVVAPPDRVFPVPERLSLAQGVALLMNYHTAHFGLVRRGRLRAGETLLVQGAAGGVGSAAVELGKAMGATVIAVVSDRGKADAASRLGADHVVLAGEGWLEEVRRLSGGGVDLAFDPVTADRFDDTVRSLAPEGRLVVIGFAGGSIPRLAMNRVLFRNIDVVGAAWGAFVDRHPDLPARTHAELVRLVESGRLSPLVGAELPLERAADALRLLEGRRAIGKVVLRVREEERA
ncbi:MAG TPA: NADPH:quinone oxidoreductase family protein [Candidatus Dormibacteraeota bacterium]|nr:NADPH:quinone oxidoreductase family protein [Candidatus Dormibacteraeota bacterium]